MAQKQIIVNGIEFKEISPIQAEKIAADCRQCRSDYIFDSVKSIARSFMNLAQRKIGVFGQYEVN